MTPRAGTAGELGSGFGLLVVRGFMRRYDGSIQVDSSQSLNGQWLTTVELEFKNAKNSYMKRAG